MAKVLIISDNHGETDNLQGIIDREKPFDLMIHCGDIGFSEGELMRMADSPVYVVAGNNDFFQNLPNRVDFTFQGHHILVTHGHFDDVYYSGIEKLAVKAGALGADLCFFGHTHVPFLREIEGVKFANPGSTNLPRQTDRTPTYMVMNIYENENPDIELKRYSF